MRELIWRAVARIVTIPAVTDWLIARARRTPYTAITSRDGTDVYMVRLWLFNPYGKDANGDPGPARWGWLPSIRVHHIRRRDDDGRKHDHPWNARTIVLRGAYEEERFSEGWTDVYKRQHFLSNNPGGEFAITETQFRPRGYTGRLLFGEYHRISWVPKEGVWTLFFTWKKRGTWGFDVEGVKVPWRKYLGLDQA